MRVLLLVGSVLVIAACDESPREVPVSPSPPVAASANSVAGVTWDLPATWSAQPERDMRVATYELPGTGGAPGECAVFHFPATGGSVEANISRWARQFEGSPAPSDRFAETRDGWLRLRRSGRCWGSTSSVPWFHSTASLLSQRSLRGMMRRPV